MEQEQSPVSSAENGMRIVVSKNGPYLVYGGVPLITEEICNDDEGYCRKW